MAILTADKRKHLAGSTFGLPGERKYPMPDRAHAANAKARATQQVKAGNLSPSSAAHIRAKANRILGGSPGGYTPNPSTPYDSPLRHSQMENEAQVPRNPLLDLAGSPGGYRPNYEGSAQDTSQDRRGAAKRGMSMDQWEGSAADRRMDARHSGKGGYYTGTGNPAQNRAVHAAEAKNHPRNHALAMASATHLLNMGHITPEHHARIQNHATNMLSALRQQQMAQPPQGMGAPDMSGGMGPSMGGGSPFGSFAPGG